jgi:flagellar basal-body rod modification protein FlgD
MSIESISAQVSPPLADPRASSNGDAMGKSDFLKLLVVQLQKQDPLNPQDPAEFTAQLTQFSSLEQLIKVNDSIAVLAGQQAFNSQIGTASFIGRTARVAGDAVGVSDGVAGSLHYELPADSARTSISVYDANDNLVEVVDLGAVTGGGHDYQWPATSQDGVALPDGVYRLEVVAQDVDGNTLSAETSISGVVTRVRFDRSGTLVEIGGREWPLTDLEAIW